MCFIKIFIIIKVISIKTNKNVFSIHIFPQPRPKPGRCEVCVRRHRRGPIWRPPVVEVVIGCVHHEGEHLHPPGQLLLWAQDVGAGVESLRGRGTVLCRQQPCDGRVTVRVLVSQEAPELGIVDVVIIDANHGDDVPLVEELALVADASVRVHHGEWATQVEPLGIGGREEPETLRAATGHR